MQRIAQFEKISYEQFEKDWKNTFQVCTDGEIRNIYDSIKLPERSTVGSAGYDFFLPIDMTIYFNGAMICTGAYTDYKSASGIVNIPTGIRCKIEDGWVLQMFPRSGLGFKYGLRLANTVGVIDSDYYNSDNEGHIFVKLVNDSALNKNISLKAGQAFCQGVFIPFGITYTDNVQAKRNGGFGSTDKKWVNFNSRGDEMATH